MICWAALGNALLLALYLNMLSIMYGLRTYRLAAAVELLATQPGLEEYRERAERYLMENYGDTTAVRGAPLPN